MNEQIRELMQQADRLARALEPDLREVVRYNRIRDRKFAELIVRECDRYARQNWEHGALLGGDLKNLFGIEE